MDTSRASSVKNINDDFERENEFYQLALKSAREGELMLEENKVPVYRPDDYFAEMVKSDEHMKKVKSLLLTEQKRIEDSEKRRQQRELKKQGKKVQSDRQQEKKKQERENLKNISKWRKNHGNDEMPIELEDTPNHKSNSKSSSKPALPQKSSKRQAKDAKYSRGGIKKDSKKNNFQSFSDEKDGYSLKAHRRRAQDITKKTGLQKKIKKPIKRRLAKSKRRR